MADLIWRPIPGYEGVYDVSNTGMVRRMAPARNTYAGRILAVHLSPNGYRKVRLCLNGNVRNHGVASLVCAAFHGPRPEGFVVRHLDGARTNDTPANLAWGTHAENVADSLRHGTQASARKTHCKRGHEFNVENTYVTSRGRNCRACGAMWRRFYYAKKKAQVAA